MKRPTDQERLLDDVLTEESSVGANASLDHLLRLARRRRHGRLARRAGGILAVVIAGVLVLLQPFGTRKAKPELAHKPVVPPSCEIVTTFALTPEQLVSSRPLAPEQIVHSANTVTVVRTTATDIPLLNDEELLNLAKPNIAVLVGRGPHAMELVFVEPLPASH